VITPVKTSLTAAIIVLIIASQDIIWQALTAASLAGLVIFRKQLLRLTLRNHSETPKYRRDMTDDPL
jgi:hypothetical protein